MPMPTARTRRLAPAVRAHRVPGAHATLGVEPRVETLAARIREALAAGRAASAVAREDAGDRAASAPGAARRGHDRCTTPEGES